MNDSRFSGAALALSMALAIVLGGCATADQTRAPENAKEAAELACLLPSNCVSSLGSIGLPPLRYTGSGAQGMAALQATLATFPEAKVIRRSDATVEAIFTTPAGFTDEVAFRIDPSAQRIDFRSRSGFGLFDFGKNRSRMQDFATRFAAQGVK